MNLALMKLKVDPSTDYLLMLKGACSIGLVCLTKTEWDELTEFDSIFMLHHEVESRKEVKPKFNSRRVVSTRGL